MVSTMEKGGVTTAVTGGRFERARKGLRTVGRAVGAVMLSSVLSSPVLAGLLYSPDMGDGKRGVQPTSPMPGIPEYVGTDGAAVRMPDGTWGARLAANHLVYVQCYEVDDFPGVTSEHTWYRLAADERGEPIVGLIPVDGVYSAQPHRVDSLVAHC